MVPSMYSKQREWERGAAAGQLCTRLPLYQTVKRPEEGKSPSPFNLQTAEVFNPTPLFEGGRNKT